MKNILQRLHKVVEESDNMKRIVSRQIFLAIARRIIDNSLSIELKREDIERICKISRRTYKIHMRSLIQEGFLDRRLSGRGNIYSFGPKVTIMFPELFQYND